LGEKEIKDLVLPVKALSEIVRSAGKEEKKVSLLVDADKQQVIFKIGEIEWVSRLLAGDFPPYSQIMPSDHLTKLTIGKSELVEAVKRAVIFARESANIIKLSIESGKMVVSANSAQVGGGETEVEVDIEGESLVVAFNGKYLLDYLNVTSSEEIVFENAGPLKAGVFKVAGKKLIHVIMPVRVQS
jgi:DNA polymerase-3 subunit beta